MIDVKPEGRLANNLFQYVFARLIHESTGLALNYTVSTRIFNTPALEGLRGVGAPITVTDFFDTGNDHLVDLDGVISEVKGKNVIVHGFFQNKKYFNHRRDLIKSWLGKIPATNPDCTGIHIRKTDYVTLGWDLKDDYYDECLRLANPEKLVIFTDSPGDPYVKKLIAAGGQLCLEGPERSMFLLGTCGKQIMSRSTYSWWSAFLSSPEKVYYPRPSSGWWSVKDTPHKILDVDSSEYCYIDV